MENDAKMEPTLLIIKITQMMSPMFTGLPNEKTPDLKFSTNAAHRKKRVVNRMTLPGKLAAFFGFEDFFVIGFLDWANCKGTYG